MEILLAFFIGLGVGVLLGVAVSIHRFVSDPDFRDVFTPSVRNNLRDRSK